MFDGAITFGVIQNPIWFLVVTVGFILMAIKRKSYMEIMEDEQEKMRKELLKKWTGRQ